jgi:hypothetical protein
MTNTSAGEKAPKSRRNSQYFSLLAGKGKRKVRARLHPPPVSLGSSLCSLSLRGHIFYGEGTLITMVTDLNHGFCSLIFSTFAWLTSNSFAFSEYAKVCGRIKGE